MSRPVTLLSVAGLLALATPAAGQTFSNPRVVGMAGAVRGDPLANSALLVNPAGMARAYTYAAEVAYNRAGPGDLNAAGINVVDSKTQPALAVGAAYAYQFTDPDAPIGISGHDARLAFAHAAVPNKVFFGVGLHYLHLDGDEPVDDLKGFTLDAGALISLTPSFHVGLSGQNLIDRDDPRLPRLAGGGVAYTGEILAVDFDTVVDFSTADSPKPIFALGAEALLGETVPVRLGVRRDQALERTFVGGGVGFLTTGEGARGNQFNVAFLQSVDETDVFQFSAGITLFL